KPAPVLALAPANVLGKMLEGQVMDNQTSRYRRSQGQKSIGGKKKVYLMLFQRIGHTAFQPGHEEQGVSCLGTNDHRMHIRCRNKRWIKVSIKEEVEFVFRVATNHGLQGLTGEPSDSFQTAFE